MKDKITIPQNCINSFGSQLRKLLKDNKLTQQQLADSIGVSLNAVNDWINDKSQPKWLLQLFGTIQFFYKNVDGFNPLQLFYLGEQNTDDVLQTTIEKSLEHTAMTKAEKVYQEKLNSEIQRIQQQANAEIDKIKTKYNTYQIDKLVAENEKLKNNSKGTKGRQDYTQFKDKLNEKYKKLEQEFEEYKDKHNALSMAELSNNELEQLSLPLTYKHSISFGKIRMKKVLTDTEFFDLLRNVFLFLLNIQTNPTYEEIGKGLCDIVDKTISNDFRRTVGR